MKTAAWVALLIGLALVDARDAWAQSRRPADIWRETIDRTARGSLDRALERVLYSGGR